MDEVDLLRWPDPLGPEWQATVEDSGEDQLFTVTEGQEGRGSVTVRFVAQTAIRDTYPYSTRDRLLEPSETAPAEAIQLVSEMVMEQDPACRRLVIAADEEDLKSIDAAERGGYRYVTEVDIPGRALALLAAEPAWVLEESRDINNVPLESGAD